MFNNERKKEWVDMYKKVLSEFRNEERRLIQTLAEDFHINKIFLGYTAEVDNDKKTLEETRLNIKYYIDEAFSYFNGTQKGKNYDIKQRLYKIKEAILKNRVDNKNKFEALLMEEDELEKEIHQFETIFNSEMQKEQEEEKEAIRLEEDEIVNKQISTNKTMNELEEYFEYVMNSGNIVFEKYNEDDVTKIINKINDMNICKNKTTQIDNLIDKLGSQNLGWQANYHQDFLRLKAIHNGKINTYDFLTALENTLPFFPKSELKNHIRLYNKYHQLYEAKKLLVNRYKTLKTEKDEQEKKQVLEKVIVPQQVQAPMTPQVDKKKIEEWKQKKQQEKEMEEQIKKNIEKAKREQEKMKHIEKMNKVKPMIEEYKKQKEREKEKQIEKLSTHEINETDLDRIREKNEKLVEKKILVSKTKPLEKIRRAKSYVKFRLKQMEKLEAIEPKLEEKTEGYIQKERKKHDPKKDKGRIADTMGGNVLYHTNRAIPQWRKGL
jgi:hypothetical protein